MFLDERFTQKCSLIKRSLVRFADQPVPKALLIFHRFASVHNICADLPPHKLFSVRHYTMPCAHQQNLCACVLIKELKGFMQKGRISNFGRFSFFAGSSWFLADWLVLTWKVSFRNFCGRLALRSPEITYAKRLSFAWSSILMSKSFKGRFRLLLAALTTCFL